MTHKCWDQTRLIRKVHVLDLAIRAAKYQKRKKKEPKPHVAIIKTNNAIQLKIKQTKKGTSQKISKALDSCRDSENEKERRVM